MADVKHMQEPVKLRKDSFLCPDKKMPALPFCVPLLPSPSPALALQLGPYKAMGTVITPYHRAVPPGMRNI